MTTDLQTQPYQLPSFRLDDRVVLLTGAAGHLGRALAFGFARSGAHVVLNGRTSETIHQLAEDLQAQGFQATACAFDLTDETRLEEAIRDIEKRHDRLDVLVNNAYTGKAGTVESDSIENFDAAYHLTVSLAFRTVQLALPLLEKAGQTNPGGASVINIGSMYGMVSPDPAIYGDSGQNNPPHYGAAKAGLIQLTRYLACHLAPKNIRVNALSPGPFPRPEVADTNPVFHAELCRKTPMGRIGRPEELIGPALFLASDAASYVTGANLPADGGWTAW